MIKDLIKDLTKYAPSYLVPAIIGIIALPVITRLFPPADYGNYVLVISTISLLSAIAVPWISSSIIRYYPSYKSNNQIDKFLIIVIILIIISVISVCLIYLMILFFIRGYISNELYSAMSLGALLFLVTSVWQVLLNLLRAKRLPILYSSFTIWSSIAAFGLGIMFVIIFHYGINGLILGSTISLIIAFPLLYKLAIGNLSLRKMHFRSPISIEIAKFGLPIMAVNLSGWIINMADRFIIQIYRGSTDVGIYAASNSVSGQSMLIISSLFLLAQGPVAYNIWENQGIEASRGFTNKFTRYYLLIGLPAAIGLAVLAKPIISVICAPEYYQGYKIIPLMVFGGFLNGLINSFTLGLTYYKRSDLLMYCTLGSVLLGLGLNFLLIPKLGYMGAAITYFVTWVVDLIVIVIISRRYFVWPFPMKSLIKITFASLIMGIVVYLISKHMTSSSLINLIASICIGIIVYILMIFLLREPQREEIKELQAIRKGILGR